MSAHRKNLCPIPTPRNRRPAVLATSIAALFALGLVPSSARAQNLGYVADNGNGFITDFDTTTGTANINYVISNPYGLTSSNGLIYYTDATDGLVGVLDPTLQTSNTLVTGLSFPNNVAVSGSNMYITDSSTNSVDEYDTSGNLINTNLVAGLKSPNGVVVSGNTLFVLNGADEVGEYNATTGAPIKTNLVSGLRYAFDLVVCNNVVYVLECPGANNEVNEYNATTGALIKSNLVPAFSANGLAVSGNTVYITYTDPDTFVGMVGAYNATSGVALPGFTPPSGADNPFGIAINNLLGVDALGPNPLPNDSQVDAVIDAMGTSGAVPLSASTTYLNSLTQAFTTASVIDLTSSTLHIGSGIFIQIGGADLTIGTVPNSGTLVGGGAAGNVAGNLTLGNDTANTLTINSVIANNGTGLVSVVADGTGNTILAGVNTYTGTTQVSYGNLEIGTTTAASNAGVGGGVSIGNGGILTLVNVSGNVFANSVSNGMGGIGSLTIDSANTNTLSGLIADGDAGQIGLTQSGAGTTILTHADTYTGATTVSDGILQIGVAKTAGAISANGTVMVGTGGTVNLINVSGGTFGSAVENGLGGEGRLNVDSVNTNTLSGTLTDGGAGQLALTQGGTGTTILTNSGNTYSGDTTVSGGILQIGTSTEPGSIGANSDVSITTGGTLVLINASSSFFVNDVTNDVGEVGTLKIDSPDSYTLSGTLTDGADGQLALTQSGAGTTILTNGNNTYSGATTIDGGILQIGTATLAGSIGASSAVSVGGEAKLVLVNVNGNTFVNDVTNNVGGTGTLEINSAKTNTLSGSLTNGTGTGTLAVTQSGSGTTILTNADNTYSGATTVSGGILQIGTAGTAGSIGPMSAVSIGDGAMLEVVNVSNNLLANNISNGLGGVGTLEINSANTNTLSGELTNGAGSQLTLLQSGSGTTILTNAKNTYSGPTTVSDGILEIGRGTTAGSIGASSVISVTTGGTLSLANVAGNTFASSVKNGAAGVGILNVNTVNATTLSGALADGLAGQLALTQTGTGMAILTNGNNTYSGATAISTGILEVGTATAAGSIGSGSAVSVGSGGTLLLVNLSSAVLANSITNGAGGAGLVNANSKTNITLGGVLSNGTGTLALTQSGAGTTTLTATDTYTGATTVSAGTLQVGNGTSGNLADTTVVTVSGTAGLVTNLGSGVTFVPAVNLSAKGTSLKAIQSGTNTLSGVISGSGVFDQNGTGKTVLSATENYVGATTVNAGTLEVDGALAAAGAVKVATGAELSGDGSVQGKVTLTGTGIIDFNAGGMIGGTLGVTGGNWNGVGTVTGLITSSSGAFNINGNLGATAALNVTGGTIAGTGTLTGNLSYTSTASSTFGGVIGGAGSTLVMNKTGATLTLTGTNTYTGATTISSGTVMVDGSLASTAVAVNSGGILGGTGTIGGPVTVNLGGTLTHSNSTAPGTITVGALDLVTGSKVNYELGLPGTAGGTVNDLTDVTGNLTLGGTLNISALFGFGAGTYDLFNYTGTLTTGTVKFGTVPTGFTAADFSISTSTAGQVDLVVNGGLAVQYWDGAVTVANGSINGGTGTWDNVTTNWTNSAGAANAKWSQLAAVFNNGTGTVTVGDNITVTALGFASGSGAYTLNVSTSKTLTITGTGIVNTSGVTQNLATLVDAVTGKVGTIVFTNSATAGSLTQITNNGGTVVSTYGGGTYFQGTSTAGSAAIINQGSTVSGALGGFTEFDKSATAGTATLTNNGGSNGGGGGTYFTATSDGGTAQATTNGNGFVDISDLTSTGMKIGSIAGSGSYFLGKKILTVGGNNLSTTVSGEIEDGGFVGGAGGSLVKTGTGTLTLSGVNTYTGATTINLGILEVDGSLAAGSTVNVATGGTLTGTGTIEGKATLIGNGTIDFGTGGMIDGALAVTGGNWTGVGTVVGVVTSSSSVFAISDNLAITAAGGLAVTGGTIGGTGTLTGSFNDTSSTSMIFGGVIAGATSTVTMNKAASILTLTGANTYGGATTVTAGTLQVGNGTITGATLGTGTVTVSTSGTLTTDLASSETFGNNVTDNGHVIVTGTSNNYTVSSLISGTGNLTKTGANIVTVTAANTYKGGTTVGAGTLLINNSTGSGTGTGAVAVNNGGTLGGSGTISGATTLASGGTLFPSADSPGTAGTTLHGSSLIWNGGGTLTLQLADGADDALALTGALTKGSTGTYTLDLINASLISTNTYNLTLVTFASSTFTASNFTVELPVNYTGILVKTSTSLEIENLTDPPPASGELPEGADLTAAGTVASGLSTPADLTVTPTPEPGSALLLTFGGAALLGWRRRRHYQENSD